MHRLFKSHQEGEHICDAAKRNTLLNDLFSVCISKHLAAISRGFETLKSMKNLQVNAYEGMSLGLQIVYRENKYIEVNFKQTVEV